MSGLLRKLQKPRSRLNDRISDVVLESSIAKSRDVDESDDFQVIRTSGDIPAPSLEQDSKVVWQELSRPFSGEIERLIGDLTRIANELVPDDSDIPVDIDAVFNTALERALRGLASNISFARFDISMVKDYFFKLAHHYGPLFPLVEDESVTEIYVDSSDSVSVQYDSRIVNTKVQFRSSTEYKLFLKFLERRALGNIENLSGRSVFLVDKERKVLSSIAADKFFSYHDPKLCLKIPRPVQLSFYDLLRARFLPAILASWLSEVCSTAAVNILVVGPNCSGRTKLAGALMNSAPSDERIVTVEELAEVLVLNPQLEKLVFDNGYSETEAANLLSFALLRGPHRILLDMLRGSEATVYLSALERGLKGCVTTIEADSAEKGLWKFCDLVMRSDLSSEASVVRRISRSISLVLVTDFEEEQPVLKEVVEVSPSKNGDFKLERLVYFSGRENGKREWGVDTVESPLQRSLSKEHKIELVSGAVDD